MVIGGQLILARVGVSFENSDGGKNFSSMGVTYYIGPSMGGSRTMECNRIILKKCPLWCRNGLKIE